MEENKKNSRPGLLMSNTRVKLQTVPAQKLLFSNKDGAIGLFQFITYVLKVCRAASLDDPYADLYLLKIYESSMLARKKIKSLQEEYLKMLEDANKEEDGLEKTPVNTSAPKIYPLKSTNKYAILGARLVVEFDRLMRILMTCCTYSILDAKKSKKIAQNVKYAIRQSFGLALLWQHTGVTRSDVRHNTQVALRAQKKMGILNNDVLVGTLRAPYAPPIKRQETNSSSNFS